MSLFTNFIPFLTHSMYHSMKTVTTLLILLSIALDTCKAQTINDPPFMLVDMRPTATPNLITLQCRRSSDASFESQAMYYLNGSNVNTVEGFVNLSEEPGTVRFIIQRRLEGEYSCGTLNQRSNSISFIGKLYMYMYVLSTTFYCGALIYMTLYINIIMMSSANCYLTVSEVITCKQWIAICGNLLCNYNCASLGIINKLYILIPLRGSVSKKTIVHSNSTYMCSSGLVFCMA